MNARQAYHVLLTGHDQSTLSGRRAYEDAVVFCRKRNKAGNWETLSTEQSLIDEAKQYCHDILPDNVGGFLLYPSVYDLLLHFERDCDVWGRYPTTMFRGQRNHDWRLCPSIMRSNVSDTDRAIAMTVQWIETAMQNHPTLCSYSPTELVAVAQHYEQQTSLLDYTTNVRVAAAFACLGWRANSEHEFGVLFELLQADLDTFTFDDGTLTGHALRHELPKVPRVQRQEGVFVGAFNISAFQAMAEIDRYYFRQSELSQSFLDDMRLGPEFLLPPMNIEPVGYSDSSNILQPKELLVQVDSYLRTWVAKAMTPMDWQSCYDWAKRFVPEDSATSEHKWLRPPFDWTDFQERRLRAYCKWFCELQKLDIPSDAKCMRRLLWATKRITDNPTPEHVARRNEYVDAMSRVTERLSPRKAIPVMSLLRDAINSEGLDPVEF